MGKYCNRCGKELFEGEVCSCNQQYEKKEKSKKIKIMIATCKRQIYTYKRILMEPRLGIKEFFEKGDKNTVGSIVFFHAVIYALFMVILCLEGLASISSISTGHSGMGLHTPFSILVIFLISVFASLGLSIVLALIFYLGSYIMKSKTSLLNVACISAIRSLVMIPFLLVAIVVSICSPLLAMIIYMSGIIPVICFLVKGVEEAIDLEEGKRFHLTWIGLIVFFISIFFVFKIAMFLFHIYILITRSSLGYPFNLKNFFTN